MPPGATAALFILGAIFFGWRFFELEDIWDEIEDYNRKIEYNFAQDLRDVFLPFEEEIYSRLQKNQDENGELTEFEDGELLSTLRVLREEVFLEAEQEANVASSVQYLVEEDHVDIEEIHNDIKSQYRTYRKPGIVFSLIRIATLAVAVSCLVLAYLALFAYSAPLMVVYGFGAGLLIWFSLEAYLWRVLSSEVIVEGGNLLGKLLKPDPRELFG